MRLTIIRQNKSSNDAFRDEKKAIDLGFTILLNLFLALSLLPIAGLAQTEQINKSRFVKTELTREKGKYIVVFNDDLPPEKVEEIAKQLADKHQAIVRATLKYAIKGFIMEATEANAGAVSQETSVDHIEEVGSFNISKESNSANSAQPEQLPPTTTSVLDILNDRIDQRSLPLDNSYKFYGTSGAGVNVYVVDSGINATHQELISNTITHSDADFVGDTISLARPGFDGFGHGTGVAAHVGGQYLGVAKFATLHSVRVLDTSNSGTTQTILQGLNWVIGDIILKRTVLGILVGSEKYPAVVNMSLRIPGPPANFPSIVNAIRTLIALKVTVVVAAGNDSINVSGSTPAGIPEVITVGATNSNNDSFATSFSNFGAGVDILAPGRFTTFPSQINNSTYIGGTLGGQFDGTSFAAPLVAGAAALYLSSNPSASPSTVRSALIRNSTMNVITNVPVGTPNRLLYTLYRVLAVRNAASYGTKVAPGSLATVFGDGFNDDSYLTEIWGEEPGPIYSTASLYNKPWILYWGDTQINYQVNPDLPLYDEFIIGTGNNPLNPISQGSASLALVAPGLFSANSTGQGLAAGQLLRVTISNNNQVSEQLSSNGNTLNPSIENYYLILYGTGIRFRSSLNNVSAKVGGVTVPVAYAGNQNYYLGVDQVNIGPLPASLKGVGLVDIVFTADGETANKIKVNLQ